MKRRPVRVIKLGGSLLDYADLPDALRHWLAGQPPAQHVMVVGGGPLADVIRRTHRVHGLDQAAAHWLCVDLLSVTTRLVSELLPGAHVIRSYAQLCERLEGGQTLSAGLNPCPTLFDPGSYLREDEPRLPGKRLPKNWDVSSDSIAGRLAITVGADELVLLKSALPSTPPEILHLVATGYIDRNFQELFDQLPITRAINLRGIGFPSATLKTRLTATQRRRPPSGLSR
jgi:aspartokinase-like uncharacterized kinase